MQGYSVQFRNTILQKMIGPEKRKATDLSEKSGASHHAQYNGVFRRIQVKNHNIIEFDFKNPAPYSG